MTRRRASSTTTPASTANTAQTPTRPSPARAATSRSRTTTAEHSAPAAPPQPLDVPQPANSNDAVTGIHVLDCYGADNSTYIGHADGPLSSGGAEQYPYTSNQTQYNYTVNIDDVSPATIGWGIVSQGETVTNPDPYAFDPGHWYQDEATLTATAQAVGNDLSDITGVVCAVNDPTFGQPNSSYTNPVTGQQVPYYDYTLDGNASEHPTDANNDYTVEIPVSDDNGSGTYYLSCFAVSGSGVNGTVSTTEVNLQGSSAGAWGRELRRSSASARSTRA